MAFSTLKFRLLLGIGLGFIYLAIVFVIVGLTTNYWIEIRDSNRYKDDVEMHFGLHRVCWIRSDRCNNPLSSYDRSNYLPKVQGLVNTGAVLGLFASIMALIHFFSEMLESRFKIITIITTVLAVCSALQYNHLSPEATNSIHTSFASQLEALGLWQWAVFVLLHICDGYQRQKAVQSLLQRYLQTGETFTEEENFLVEKLLIPTEWLHQAKAIRAHHEGDHHAEAYHLLQAKSWNKAHQVVLRHIAPDAIINDNHEYLRTFLDTMASDDCCVGIFNWNGQGKVFLDFINLRERLSHLKQSQPSQYDLEALQPDVLSLCCRVKGLESRNAKDYLCQAEMAKTAASLVRTFLMLQELSPTSILTKIIPDLPIPEDFSLQELQALSATALMEIV